MKENKGKFIKAILAIVSILMIGYGINLATEGKGLFLLSCGVSTILFSTICQKIYYEKHREEDGFYIGYFFGIIGLIVALCLKDNEKDSNKTNNKYEDLERLQKLKKDGAITDVEFEIEKQKILK